MYSSFDVRASYSPFRASINARVTPRRRLDPHKTTRIPNMLSSPLIWLSSCIVPRRCLIDVLYKTRGLVRDKVINLDHTKQQLGKQNSNSTLRIPGTWYGVKKICRYRIWNFILYGINENVSFQPRRKPEGIIKYFWYKSRFFSHRLFN